MTQPSASPYAPPPAVAPRPPLPPPPPPVWPRPEAPASSTVLRVAGLAGLAAAIFVPTTWYGLGWPLAGLALAGLVVALARTAPAGPERTRRAGALWIAGALGLLAMTALRSAEWLLPMCVFGAALAGSIAVAGGRSVRGLLLGTVAVLGLSFGALPWARRGITAASSRDRNLLRTAGAAVVSLALLAVFTALLAGADAGFAALLPDIDVLTVLRWASVFLLFGAAMIAAGYLLSAPPRPDKLDAERPQRLRLIEWALPVGVLVALFGVFVAVQLAALFGGAEYVQRTTGLSYAEYARSGFWQLLAVTVLTLAVIMTAARYGKVSTAADRRWQRALLGALAVLTLVIVASALTRMWAYQQAYGFTVLRLLVFGCELWLGLVYLLLLASGVRDRATWLARAIAGSGLAALLALAALNPDRFIAEHNIQRWRDTGKIDLKYLSELSPDAAPALAVLPEPMRGCALWPLSLDVDDPVGWRSWNPARSAAWELTAGMPRPPSCDMSRR
ncbi:DUF4153 domain-containing protein [Pseudonocardia acaciae]|uniref:DUF4153 domain-containing protein n=1 Tax=Pseudonocardia acaciae TaxID=551276 RepID=UPI000688970A|nr:DUF4173 domain-containing protein [Pseudonocardia acaciae]